MQVFYDLAFKKEESRNKETYVFLCCLMTKCRVVEKSDGTNQTVSSWRNSASLGPASPGFGNENTFLLALQKPASQQEFCDPLEEGQKNFFIHRKGGS